MGVRLPSPALLRVGGALQQAVAPLHDPRSTHTIVYHPLWPGVELTSRGHGVEASARELPEEAWVVPTQALGPDRITVPARDGARLYVWATKDRVLHTDEYVEGSRLFYSEKGRWQSHEPSVVPEQCVFPDCDMLGQICSKHLPLASDALVALAKQPHELPPLGRTRWREVMRDMARGGAGDDAFVDVLRRGKGFLVHPTSREGVKRGESVAFRVAALGAPSLTWLKDGKKFSRGDLLVLRGVTAADVAEYSCAFDDVVSQIATLTLDDAFARVEAAKRLFGDRVATRDECRDALLLDPDDDRFNAKVLARLADIAWADGDKLKALTYATDAILRGGDAHATRARAAFSLGFYREALAALAIAHRKNPEPWHATLKAEILEALRRKTEEKRAVAHDRSDDLITLGFTSGATPSRRDLRRHYLDRARQAHPDKGGDHATFLAVQAAYERLLETL